MQDAGYQIAQSLFALGTGGLTGTGPGFGRPQDIPFSATDAIFSVIGEELGLLGASALLLAFLLLAVRGFKIALTAKDEFSTLLAVGLTVTLAFQTFVIIGGLTRLVPADRHHAAVRVLRRVVAARQLPARSACCCAPATSRARRPSDATGAVTAAARREAARVVNRSIGRVAAVVLVLFGALFVNLNVIALVQADDLANHPANRRLIIREYAIERGPIVVGEEAIARSVETDGGDLRYLRTYPDGPLYAHLTGYYSFILQRSGARVGPQRGPHRPVHRGGRAEPRRAARRQRPGRQHRRADHRPGGATRRGRRARRRHRRRRRARSRPPVRSSPATPTRPTTRTRCRPTTPSEIRETWEALNADESRPLVDRAAARDLPAGLDLQDRDRRRRARGRRRARTTTFDDPAVFDVPQTTADIGNFGGGTCNGGNSITLADALRVSCNTTFAELARRARRRGARRRRPSGSASTAPCPTS